MLILNELKYAEKIIKTNEYEEKISIVINALAKYYLHYLKYDDNTTMELLHQFLKKENPDYIPTKWTEKLKKTISYANKNTLLTIDYVSLTETEIDVVCSLESKPLQRLAFALLSFAKAYNLINPNNNNWVNAKQKEIFTSAHISGKSINDQNSMLHSLYKLGLISFSKKASNLNIQVNFVDENSDKVCQISDFRDLGFEYLLYKGENYIRCEKCNRPTKDNVRHTKKYCSPCSKYEVAKSNIKTLICANCGKEFMVYNKNANSDSCSKCYTDYRKKYKAMKEKERRNMLKQQSVDRSN